MGCRFLVAWNVVFLPFCFLVIFILFVRVLSVLFLVAVISLSQCFSLLYSSRCIDATTLSSILVRPLPFSFLDIYRLSMSSLGCNALCMVISFLVLWSICLSSSLVHLKNGPGHLTRKTALLFIPLIRFWLYSFVSSSFLVFLRYSFLIFFFYFHLFDGVSF